MKIPKIFQERDPTKGNIVKNTVLMSNPLWINTIFWALIHSLNLFWVSRLGAEAIAALAIGSTTFMLLMMPIQGLVTATYGLVGSFDREDKAGLERLVKQILSITLITSVLLVVFGYFSAPSLLQLLGAEKEVTSLAVTYLRICALGGIVSFLFWPLNEMIRCTRDMFRPMLFMGLVLLLQGIFDYLLILGNFGFPRMGVTGAALSSTFSAAIGAAAVFFALIRGKLFIKITLKNWRDFQIKFQTLKDVVGISGFDTAEGTSRMVASMVMLAIVAPFGTFALAAFHIGQRFFRYASTLGMDLSKTAAITVSNVLCTGDIKRAKRSGWLIAIMGAGLMGAVGLALFIFAEQLVGIFTQDAEVLAIGVSYLKITTLLGFGYFLFGLGSVLRRVFAAAKDTRTPMFIYWFMAGIQLGLAVVLSKYFGLGINGVWIAILIGMLFYGLALAVLFKIGRWKPKNKI